MIESSHENDSQADLSPGWNCAISAFLVVCSLSPGFFLVPNVAGLTLFGIAYSCCLMLIFYGFLFRSTHQQAIRAVRSEIREWGGGVYFLLIFYGVLAYWFAIVHYGLFRLDPGNYVVANPSAWEFLDFFYYSVITITTIGYGDISPVSVVAKLASIAEVLLGWAYLVYVVAVAISKLTQHQILKDSATAKNKARFQRLPPECAEGQTQDAEPASPADG